MKKKNIYKRFIKYLTLLEEELGGHGDICIVLDIIKTIKIEINKQFGEYD